MWLLLALLPAMVCGTRLFPDATCLGPHCTDAAVEFIVCGKFGDGWRCEARMADGYKLGPAGVACADESENDCRVTYSVEPDRSLRLSYVARLVAGGLALLACAWVAIYCCLFSNYYRAIPIKHHASYFLLQRLGDKGEI